MDIRSHVHYIDTRDHRACLLVTPYSGSETRIIWFDPFFGFPIFQGIHGYDVFSDIRQAKQFLLKNYGIARSVPGKFLIGMNIINNMCVILLATAVEKVGFILETHSVYKITDCKFIYYDTWSIDETKTSYDIKSYFENFQIKNVHFFCPTFDITAPFKEHTNDEMVWNAYLSKPFEKLGFNDLCIKLIQGSFKVFQQEKYTIFSIMRRRCEGAGPPKDTFGISSRGDVGNETEIELVIQVPHNNGFLIHTHILRTCMTPVTMQSKTSSRTDESLAYAPVFYNRIFQYFGIKQAVLLDLNHTGIATEASYSKSIQHTIQIMRNVFDIDFIKYDWSHEIEINRNNPCAVDGLFQAIYPTLDRYGTNKYYFVGGKRIESENQKGLILVSCRTGVDKSLPCAFLIGFRMLVNMMYNLELISKKQMPLSIPDLLKFDKSIRMFMCSAYIYGSEIISRIFFSSQSSAKFIMTFFKEGRPVEKSKIDLIIQDINDIRDNQNERSQEILKQIQIFTGVIENMSSPHFSLKNGTKLVSANPGVHIISPSDFNPSVFSFQSFYEPISVDQPLIISLPCTCRVVELLIRSFTSEEQFAQPSSISVYGGMYVNKLFPIMMNITVARTNRSVLLHYPIQSHQHYNHEIDPNLYQPVRYLAFYFNSSIDRTIMVPNIYVFGVDHVEHEMALPNNLKIEEEEDKMYDKLKYSTVVENEEHRLCTYTQYNDFQDYVIQRNINPGALNINNILEAYIPQDESSKRLGKLCSVCVKNQMEYICCICRHSFCSSCSKRIELTDIKNEKITLFTYCETCGKIRNEIIQTLPRLESLKIRMMLKLYPFLGEIVSLPHDFDVKFQSTPDIIQCRLISQPPNGFDGNIAENIFDTNGDLWKPRETLVTMSVLFRQPATVSSIEILCDYPVVVEIDDEEEVISRKFVPPMTSQAVKIKARLVNMRIIGSPIAIRRIQFRGSYELSEITRRSITPKYIKYNIKRKKAISVDKSSHQCIELQKTTRVFGLYFYGLKNVKNFFIEAIKNQGGKRDLLPFVKPDAIDNFEVLFPNFSVCDIIKIWYNPPDPNFHYPTIYILKADDNQFNRY